MADHVQVIDEDTLVRTGAGQLMGLIVSASAGAPLITFYDNTSASGTKKLEAYIPVEAGLQLFFAERFAPMFSTGIYAELAANLTATLWWRDLITPSVGGA
jgi:hypothetical protein